ncbi:MAG: YfhO family protein [Bacteroidales bacterium]|nr:YfhO family protein [Bacteroidales bacterium]
MIYYASDISIPGVDNYNSRIKISKPLSIVISMQLLAGHAQISWYSLLFISFWVLYEINSNNGFKGWLTKATSLVCSIILALLISAIQLIPTAELLLHSQRSSQVDFEIALTYSFWPWRFLTFILPDLFGNPSQGNYWGYANYWEDAVYFGLLPLILAIRAIFRNTWFKQKSFFDQRKMKSFLLISMLVVIILALGKFTPIFPFLYQYIPSFDMFNGPTRIMIILQFILALLAGFGAHEWGLLSKGQRYYINLVAAGCIAIIIASLLATKLISESRPTFIPATIKAGILGFLICCFFLFKPIKPVRIEIWQVLILLFVFIDLLLVWKGFNPSIENSFYEQSTNSDTPGLPHIKNGQRVFINPENEYKLKYDRFLKFSDFEIDEDWQNMRMVLLPNINILDGVNEVNNFDPLVFGRLKDILDILDKDTNGTINKWLALMNVGLIEDVENSSITDQEFIFFSEGRRFIWSNCAINAEDQSSSLQLTSAQLSGQKQIEEEIVFENMSWSDSKCYPEGDLSFTETVSKNNYKQFQVNAESNGFLLLSETMYPGWLAKIDGKRNKLFYANYIFKGLEIPSGKHTLEIVYRPMSFRIGSIISFIAILYMIFMNQERIINRR